ncbi:MAG: A/G-specific adenine glycosylase [Patescibacteria group bacterium]
MNHKERTTKMRRLLLTWYQKAKRDLPWRKTQDPYAIVLSEVMLQQTQVDRVIPKWEAWLQLFPTWASLAHAKTADVLKAWSGLGYNRRALMLQKLAATVEEWGSFPQDEESMRTLPGIGPYTAGAVAAFAFRIKGSAPVDTNIDRVLRRVFGYHKKDAKAVAALAKEVVPTNVASWNHALMDLGASKCTARRPQCETCPLQTICASYPCKGDDIVKVKQKKFEGSDRMYRGRLLKALHKNVILRRNNIAKEIGLSDNLHIQRIIDGLQKDGFISIDAQGNVRIAEMKE